MKKKIYFTIIICICGIIAEILSAPHSGLRVREKTTSSIILEWQAPDIIWQRVQNQSREYVIPEMGELLTRDPGAPQLPIVSFVEQFDQPVNISLDIVDSVYVIQNCETICPAPEYNITDNETKLVYQENQSLYETNQYHPKAFFSISKQKQKNVHFWRLQLNPILYNPVQNTIKYLRYATIRIQFLPELEKTLSERSLKKSEWYDPTRPYLKIATTDSGIYSVTGQDFNRLGINPGSIDEQTFRLYHQGILQPVLLDMDNSSFDVNDRLLFYAERRSGEDGEFFNVYSDTNMYWLTWGTQPGLYYKFVESDSLIGDTLGTLTEQLHLEKDTYYYSGDNNLAIYETTRVPGEGWYWAVLYVGSQFKTHFSLTGFVTGQDSIELRMKLRGTTLSSGNPDHHALIKINGVEVGDVLFNDTDNELFSLKVPADILLEKDNELILHSVDDLNTERSQFLLDWFECNYLKKTRAQDGWIPLSNLALSDSTIIRAGGFLDNSIRILHPASNSQIKPLFMDQGWEASLRVISAGLEDGNFARFYINEEMIYEGGRGYNLVVIDPITGELLRKRNFDTWGNRNQVDSLVHYIENLEKDLIVMMGIRDEGSANMTDAAYSAIEMLGSQSIRDIKARDSWALIGKKGALVGSVPESHEPRGQGPAQSSRQIDFEVGSETWRVFFRHSDAATAQTLVFDESGIKTPKIRLDSPSWLRSFDNQADYLIITHKKFKKHADNLAKHRQTVNGFTTRVVCVEDIYDEFNHGLKDSKIIRDFVFYAYRNWQKPLVRFLLFFGDASTDPRQIYQGKEDYVSSYGSPVSDYWFTCLDEPGDVLAELSVGRIPVETEEQAIEILQKIKDYETTPSDLWKKTFLFISGGFEYFEQQSFIQQNNKLAKDFVLPPPATGKIKMINKKSKGLREGENRQEIVDAINEGTVWTNFVGHAGSRTWDLMFHNPDVDMLNNLSRYPFITSMTCHTGRFAEPTQDSFGEYFVRAPGKGAIAFLGTSGWGYSYEDYLFLRKLYNCALLDSVRYLGDILTKAKINLWQDFGSSVHIRHMILQYNLLGDPALKLALAEKPDFAFSPVAFSVDPILPTEADSTATVSVTFQNFGLWTPDSVKISLYGEHPVQGRFFVGEQTKQLISGYQDTCNFTLKLQNLAGIVKLEALIDPEDHIVEVEENNNSTTEKITITSSQIQIISPQTNQLLPNNRSYIKIQNPAKSLTYEIVLDTTQEISSTGIQKSNVMPSDSFYIKWPVHLPIKYSLIYFAVRDPIQHSVTFKRGYFYRDPENRFGWRQSIKQDYDNTLLESIEWKPDEARLRKNRLDILIQSAGLNDGRYAIISINADVVMEAQRGYNIAVYNDTTGKIVATKNFDTYGSFDAAKEMSQFLREIKSGYMVLAAINDEGSMHMTEEAFLALESIGSKYCREIGYRDSWALLTRKGGDPEQNHEVLRRAGTGPAVVRDSLSLFDKSGKILARNIGPSNKWRVFSWDIDVPEETAVSLDIIGKNQQTGKMDTLIHANGDQRIIDLSSISAKLYPGLQLQAKFSTGNRYKSPVLKNWQLTYEPVPDIAMGPQLFSQSVDTLLTGEVLDLELRVYNLGLCALDSFNLMIEESNPATGRQIYEQRTIQPVQEDSLIDLKFTWNSAHKSGRYQIRVIADPQQDIRELNESNNQITTNVYVKADTTEPNIHVTFDEQEILSGDLVSARPVILARIYDNSPLAIKDTSLANFLLDGQRLLFADEELIRLKPMSSGDSRALVEITPVLKDGEHTLEILVSDASGNRSYHRDDFKVVEELRFIDLFNYPNPFVNDTEFTFVLTQPARVLIKIYTVAGRLIRTLEEPWCIAGFHRLYWDGRDQEGDELANGVYLYKAMADDQTKQVQQVGKLMIMR